MSDADLTRNALAGNTSSRGGPWVVLAILVSLVLVKITTAWALYERGWVWLHQDDYCRALMSLSWAEHPYLYPSDLHWMPLPFWIYGAAAWLGGDMHRVFIIVSQALMILAMFAMYDLGRVAYSRAVGLIVAGLFAWTTWQSVMSFSLLAEPVYYPAAIAGISFFLRWMRTGGRGALAASSILLMMAALTRYEAWLLIVIVNGIALMRLVRARPPGRVVVITIVLLAIAWIGPGWWIVLNLRVHGVPLAFYSANREAFHDALYELTPAQRIGRYPFAFVMLSPMLSGLLLAAAAKWRTLGLRGSRPLVLVAVGHLFVLTALYASGSGPSFVERIVLLQLFLLMPIAAAALASVWMLARPWAKPAVVAFVVLFAAVESYRAREIIASRRCSDYRLMGDEYLRLADYLREDLLTNGGDVALCAHDYGHMVRFLSGYPWRVHEVHARNVAETLAHHPVRLLCLPARTMGDWRADERVETAYRNAVRNPLNESRLGNWRLLKSLQCDQ